MIYEVFNFNEVVYSGRVWIGVWVRVGVLFVFLLKRCEVLYLLNFFVDFVVGVWCIVLVEKVFWRGLEEVVDLVNSIYMFVGIVY